MSAAHGRDDLEEIRASLRADAENVALALMGEPDRKDRNEWRWGKGNGSEALALQLDVARAGEPVTVNVSGAEALNVAVPGIGHVSAPAPWAGVVDRRGSARRGRTWRLMPGRWCHRPCRWAPGAATWASSRAIQERSGPHHAVSLALSTTRWA